MLASAALRTSRDLLHKLYPEVLSVGHDISYIHHVSRAECGYRNKHPPFEPHALPFAVETGSPVGL